jgi:hypothetical protein
MIYYAGISSINYGIFTYLTILYYNYSKIWKQLGIVILAFISIKTLLELSNYIIFLDYLKQENFILVSLSHLFGIIISMLFYISYPKTEIINLK